MTSEQEKLDNDYKRAVIELPALLSALTSSLNAAASVNGAVMVHAEAMGNGLHHLSETIERHMIESAHGRGYVASALNRLVDDVLPLLSKKLGK